MILKELNLIGFGKFQGKKIKLEEGINLIYGENEMGKSTIHSFVDGIFYGFLRPNVRSALYTEEHKKYDPWNGNRYGGLLIFEQEGIDYRIEREFTKGKENTKVLKGATAEDITKSIDTGSGRILQPGIHFFGFNTSVFSNTISIKQLATRTDDNLAKEVTEKLINVTTALDDEISVDRAILDLKTRMDEIGTERAPTRPYARNIKKIDSLYNEKKGILLKKDEYESFLEKKSVLLKELDKEEENLKVLEKDFINAEIFEKKNILREANIIEAEIEELNYNIEKIPPYIHSIQDDYNKYEDLEEEKNHILYKEIDNKLELLKRDYNLYKEKKSKNNILLSLSFISSIILLVIKKFIFVIPLILLVTYFIFNLIKINNKISEIQKQVNLKEKQEKTRKDKVLEKAKLQNILLDKYGVGNKADFKNIVNENQRQLNNRANLISRIEMKRDLQKRILGNNTIEDLEKRLQGEDLDNYTIDINKDQVTYKTNQSKEKIYNLKIELMKAESNFSVLEKQVSRLVEIEEDLNQKEQFKKELDSQLESLNIAINTIEELSKDIHSQFAPAINRRVSKVVDKITNGKYTNIRIDESLRISVENPKTKELIDINNLSGGTIDQLYFSLRFGIINSIGQNKLPLILDDCFIQYDDNRLKNIIKFLKEISKSRQIILFSCQNREEEIMKELAIDYNFIKLT